MPIAGTLLGEWARLAFTGRDVGGVLSTSSSLGAVVAFAAYSYALRHLDVAIVSLYTYVNPVIAVALGTLLLGEPFHLRMLVAAAIIVLGVVIVGPTSKTGRRVRQSTGTHGYSGQTMTGSRLPRDDLARGIRSRADWRRAGGCSADDGVGHEADAHVSCRRRRRLRPPRGRPRCHGALLSARRLACVGIEPGRCRSSRFVTTRSRAGRSS